VNSGIFRTSPIGRLLGVGWAGLLEPDVSAVVLVAPVRGLVVQSGAAGAYTEPDHVTEDGAEDEGPGDEQDCDH
jgi:hypothetical protein